MGSGGSRKGRTSGGIALVGCSLLALAACAGHASAPVGSGQAGKGPRRYALHARGAEADGLIGFVSRTNDRVVIVGAEVDARIDVDRTGGSLRELEDRVIRASGAESLVVGNTVLVGGRARLAAAQASPLRPLVARELGRYRGARVTLKLTRRSVVDLLRILADVSKREIEVADGVDARVTISATAARWDEILDALLLACNLTRRQVDGVIRISRTGDRAPRFAPMASEPLKGVDLGAEARARSLRSSCRGPLGAFPLGELRLVAVLSGLPDAEGLVWWPDGIPWITVKGACIGLAGGTVSAVESTRVLIQEPAPGGVGVVDRVLELGD